LIEPDGGEVQLGGAALPHGRERARRIGYLPQTGEIAWDLSVEALASVGRLPHGDRGKAAVAGALAALDLTHLADRPVSTLSGGERARALLARVLAGEPDWILADEPLAALDLAHQLGLLARLRETAPQGTGVVLVLHDLALAMNHADRVLVLDRGTLAADGPPDQALSEETIARVWAVNARWLGEPGARALVAG
jgi:iron complex transport system ATP-binding protein